MFDIKDIPEGTLFKNFKRFKGKSVFGKDINFPYGTEFEFNGDGYLIGNDKDGGTYAVTHMHSENAYDAIVPQYPDETNEDWQEKCSLYKAIKEKTRGYSDISGTVITEKDDAYNRLFDKYDKEPEVLARFRNLNDKSDEVNWNWDREYLQMAPLKDLQYLWSIVKDAHEHKIPVVQPRALQTQQPNNDTIRI